MAGVSRTNPYASLGTVAYGTVTTGVAAAQFGNVPCRLLKLKARAANTGKIYIGIAGVATASGFELSAREDTGWIPIDNLNRLYHIGENANDKVSYIALS